MAKKPNFWIMFDLILRLSIHENCSEKQSDRRLEGETEGRIGCNIA